MMKDNFDYIDIDSIVQSIDNIINIEPLKQILNKLNILEEKLSKDREKVKGAIKKLEKERKIRIVLELFIASKYKMSVRNMEQYLKLKHIVNPNVPLISKSTIDRYLREEKALIISIYDTNLYNKIITSRIEITNNGRIKGGMSFEEIYNKNKQLKIFYEDI